MDCLPHDLMVQKLHAYGFSFEVLKLINDYLTGRHLLNTWYQYLIPNFFCRTLSFSNSFFSYFIEEWNKLDPSLISNNSLSCFLNTLLKSIRPTPNCVYGACDPQGLILLTRLTVGLSHLREHKVKNGFNDAIKPQWPGNMENESTTNFCLHCQNFFTQRLVLMNEIFTLEPDLQRVFLQLYLVLQFTWKTYRSLREW